MPITIQQAIFHLEGLRAEPGLDISPEEFLAIDLALIILRTLTPSQEALVDAIMSFKTL